MTQASFPSELQPCLRGEEIVKQGPFSNYLSQFRALISAPPDTYADLYLTTLYRFMELCQSLPLVSPLKNQTTPSATYGLLNQAFSVAVAALKIRRGRVMPQHSDSEKIAEQEPRWTYALLTTVLFCSLPAEGFTDYRVGLYKSGQERWERGILSPAVFTSLRPFIKLRTKHSVRLLTVLCCELPG